MGGEKMKRLIIFTFFISFFLFSSNNEILLDAFEIKNYRMEIRQIKEKKICYLYFFKKNKSNYTFYLTYNLLTLNAYFEGEYITHEKKYNKKGQWYTVKKKDVKFKVSFFDFDKLFDVKNAQKKYRRLIKNTIGAFYIVGGEETNPDKKKVKKKYGKYYSNSFFGNMYFTVILMKNGDIGVYKSTYRGSTCHISSYTQRHQILSIALDYAYISRQYPEINFSYNLAEDIDICPQITPPKKSQKPMLNAKIKPYKNLAGNRIE